jgi:rSAM/selenodomain-associated transferase 2
VDDPAVTVIVPTFNEAASIARVVAAANAIGDEVIVADGGSTDETSAIAERAGAIVVRAPRGRGAQLHAGATRARGDVLLFLHADSDLPAGARSAIEEALLDDAVVGGNFRLRFVPPSRAARLFSWANDARRRWFHIYYGDSAIFVRRRVYEDLGGFRPLPILEDYDLVRRLERRGKTVYVKDIIVEASSRRFAHSPMRTLLVWTWIQMLYSLLDVSPDRLARHYADIR